jgi:hypothetical protein
MDIFILFCQFVIAGLTRNLLLLLSLNFAFVKNGKGERKNTPPLRAAPFAKGELTANDR